MVHPPNEAMTSMTPSSLQIKRRTFLARSGLNLGGAALAGLLARDALATATAVGPTAGRSSGAINPLHHAPRAKAVIFLCLAGGPSHLDLLDPKPLLNELSGKPLPSSFREPITAMGERGAPLLASPRTWAQHGESGLWASDWMPHIATQLDDIAVIRSCTTDGINHAGGVCQMNTCLNTAGRPSLGSWVHYGLGSANEDLPAFVVMCDSSGRPVNGPRNWGSGFMPAAHQGVRIDGIGEEPIRFLKPPKGFDAARQQESLALLADFNRAHAADRPQQSELEARIRSYELAFRMQQAAPEAVDLSQETEVTKQLYGLDHKDTETFGRNCLLARRLVERGVRFIQLFSGTGSKWDSHSDIENNHSRLCRSMDKPVAGLLADLKQRGLLDETLVVWGGEFGRTPMSEKGNGRDHNPTGFSIWMAGGGVKGGLTYGSSDDLGFKVAENPVHIHDLQATLLHLLGFDHTKLTYRFQGRDFRLTDVHGEVVHDLLA